MKVLCIICSELLEQSDDVFFTRCGHVFHLQCLTQWLERSKTCPQCREKVTERGIHRVYFAFSNNEVDDSNSSSLQERVEGLKFQIMIKEKDIKYFTSKTVTLEKQNAGLRQEVRKVESEITQKNSAIHALKEQTKYFKEQSTECESLRGTVTRLKNKLEELRSVQMLVQAPIEDANEMVRRTKDPYTLIKYVSVLKKELLTNLNKCKKLRITVKKLQDEVAKVTARCDSLAAEQYKRMQLEEDLAISESKLISSQKRVNDLEQLLGITKEPSNVSELEKKESKESTSVRNSIGKVVQNEVEVEKVNRNCAALKHRSEKISAKSIINLEEVPKLQLENDGLIELEINSAKYSTLTDSSRAVKRPRVSINRKDNEGTSSLNKIHSDSKSTDQVHYKSKKAKESVKSTKKEKLSNSSKERDNSYIIDV